MTFDAKAYLERIGANAPTETSLGALAALHRAQSFSIPFENFDILLGRGVDVSAETVFEKLVRNRRGGYCFEANGLFLRALQHFGFDARALLARVHMGGVPSGRTHQVSLVDLGGDAWLADAGFGVFCPRAPLRLERGLEQTQDGMTFRLNDVDPWGTMLQVSEGEGWRDLYSFDFTVVTAADIEVGNHFTSTSPNSPFTRMRIATLPTERGRMTLADLKFTRFEDGEPHREMVSDDAAYLDRLKDVFGIELRAGYADLPPVPASD